LPELNSIRDVIYYSYANLAMAHSAVDKKLSKYSSFNFMIRSRLFKGLQNGTMNIRSLFDDEKVKINIGEICNYCGATKNLSLDHIFPKKMGGTDIAENLIYACKSCNSSKGKKDLMEWMTEKGKFLPLFVIRRYLKLTFNYCNSYELLDKKIEEIETLDLPFKIRFIPLNFLNPDELVLI
jgi:hypothetical protein